jgi:hypothetical protein
VLTSIIGNATRSGMSLALSRPPDGSEKPTARILRLPSRLAATTESVTANASDDSPFLESGANTALLSMNTSDSVIHRITGWPSSISVMCGFDTWLRTVIGECVGSGWKNNRFAGGGGSVSGVNSSKITTSKPSASAGFAV